ncbi:MAG: protein kinase domain-containing protein [Aureliella sp.]
MSDKIDEQTVVSRFASLWDSGEVSSVEEYCNSSLGGATENADTISTLGELSHSTLAGLVQVEVQARKRQGESLNFEEYVGRFPNLDVDVLRDIVSLPLPPIRERSESLLPARYQQLSKLGQGGIGEVWKAWDTQLEREVAVKTIREEYRLHSKVNARLEREALITGCIQHPGVPPIHGFGRLADGSVHVVMRQVEGQTFAEILKQTQTTDGERTRLLGIFLQVAQTVAFAHNLGFIHRDLKPQNVMVGRFGEVQVLDWGMAKRTGDDELAFDNADERGDDHAANVGRDESASLTRDGDIFGTPAYMSPEQARGDRDSVGPPSDVFALGAILYEILTGNRVYRIAEHDDDSKSVLKMATLGDTKAAVNELERCAIDERLKRLCCSCLQSEIDKRPADAEAVAESVSEYLVFTQKALEDARIQQRTAEVKAVEESKRRKASVWWLSGILAASVIGTLGVAWQWGLATFARDEASAARLLAESRFIDAKKTVDEYLGEVASSGSLLSATPGTQDLRRSLLNKAKTYYVTFTQTKPDSSEIREQLADAYQSLGTIGRELGDGAETVDVLEKSIEIRDELIGEGFRPDQQFQAKIAAMNELAIAYDAVGALPKAIKTCENVKRLMTAEIEGASTPLEKRLEYAKAMSTLGTAHSRAGDDDASRKAQEEVVEYLETAHSEYAGDVRAQVAYAEALRRLAVSEMEANERNSAREHLELARGLATNDELERSQVLCLATISNTLGQVLWDDGESDEAIKVMRSSCEQLERLAKAEPLIAEPIRVLGNSYNKLGYFLTATSKDEALAIFAKSVPVLERATENRPESVGMLKELAEAYAMRGEYWLQQRESALALEDVSAGIEINEKRRELAPTNRDVVDLIIGGYKSKGILLRRLGRPDEGAEAYRKGISLIEELEDSGRASRETLRSKAGIFNNLAYLYQQTDQLRQAIEPYDRAIDLYESLADGDEVRIEYYYRASSLTNKGTVLAQLGQNDEALECLDESIDMLEASQKQRPDNRMMLQFLFESYVYRSEALDKAGRYTEANADLDAALALPLPGNPFANLARIKQLAVAVSLGVIESSIKKLDKIVEGSTSDFYAEASRVPARAAVHYLESTDVDAAERDSKVKQYAELSADYVLEALDQDRFMFINPSVILKFPSVKRLWELEEFSEVRTRFDDSDGQ